MVLGILWNVLFGNVLPEFLRKLLSSFGRAYPCLAPSRAQRI